MTVYYESIKKLVFLYVFKFYINGNILHIFSRFCFLHYSHILVFFGGRQHGKVRKTGLWDSQRGTVAFSLMATGKLLNLPEL